LTFLVFEGFSGTGKTTLAKTLERRGWLRLAESAHVVPKEIPVADRADTFSDYSLIGATMQYCSIISKKRMNTDIVAEGYFLSDLAYALIRYDTKKSTSFPQLLEIVKSILKEQILQPDLYIILKAQSSTILKRQAEKNEREKNVNEFFRRRYYSGIEYLHREMSQGKYEVVSTDDNSKRTLERILAKLRNHGLWDSHG